MIPAIFLDRDGVINIDTGYVNTCEKFQFNKGIFSVLSLLQKTFKLFIITNQSGIGRQYFSEANFLSLTQWMLSIFACHNITIEKVYYCPHTPEDDCLCRKPRHGMITQAQEEHRIDLENSWLIGDKESDISCALNAPIPNSILVSKKTHTLTKTTQTFIQIPQISDIPSAIKKAIYGQ
jgi:D-glycero-D-manno-heptose 1,7-bisphosphate phosphatase